MWAGHSLPGSQTGVCVTTTFAVPGTEPTNEPAEPATGVSTLLPFGVTA